MKIKYINKQLLAKVAALAIVTGTIANETIIVKQNQNIKDSFTKVIEDFKDDTLLDEAEQENIAMYEDMTITEAADKVLNLIENYDSLSDKDKKWLENNAKAITKETLLWALKSSVANELDIQADEIQSISLPYTNEYKDLVLSMTYKDKEYKISKKDEYALNTLYFYYQVKANNQENDPKYKTIKTALNSAKILTMTATTEENNTLNSKRDIKEAKKLLK